MSRINIEWGIIVVVLALAGFSSAIIWSTNSKYLNSQVVFFIAGTIIYLIIAQLDSRIFKALAVPLYITSIVVLLFTLVNPQIRGASRWIDILGFKLQPSEITKPFLIISYSYFLTMRWKNNIISLGKNITMLLFPLLIIYLQPDLGNVIIYFLFLAAMLFADNLSLKVILASSVTVILASPFLWNLMHDYQKKRIISFLNPQSYAQGAGYNSIQAMIAVGSGKILGMGLGRGTQSHLRFLPENYTDFIFASLIEELGLFAGILLLSFYLYILWAILNISSKTSDKFSYLITIGIFVQILAQVFINISMNIGLLPITGVTLPLLSAGGSSVLSTFISLGIISAIKKEYKTTALVIR